MTFKTLDQSASITQASVAMDAVAAFRRSAPLFGVLQDEGHVSVVPRQYASIMTGKKRVSGADVYFRNTPPEEGGAHLRLFLPGVNLGLITQPFFGLLDRFNSGDTGIIEYAWEFYKEHGKQWGWEFGEETAIVSYGSTEVHWASSEQVLAGTWKATIVTTEDLRYEEYITGPNRTFHRGYRVSANVEFVSSGLLGEVHEQSACYSTPLMDRTTATLVSGVVGGMLEALRGYYYPSYVASKLEAYIEALIEAHQKEEEF